MARIKGNGELGRRTCHRPLSAVPGLFEDAVIKKARLVGGELGEAGQDVASISGIRLTMRGRSPQLPRSVARRDPINAATLTHPSVPLSLGRP